MGTSSIAPSQGHESPLRHHRRLFFRTHRRWWFHFRGSLDHRRSAVDAAGPGFAADAADSRLPPARAVSARCTAKSFRRTSPCCNWTGRWGLSLKSSPMIRVCGMSACGFERIRKSTPARARLGVIGKPSMIWQPAGVAWMERSLRSAIQVSPAMIIVSAIVGVGRNKWSVKRSVSGARCIAGNGRRCGLIPAYGTYRCPKMTDDGDGKHSGAHRSTLIRKCARTHRRSPVSAFPD